MNSKLFACLLAAVLVAGCGGDDAAETPTPSELADASAPPDPDAAPAPQAPDASVCVGELCGGVCVDLQTDRLNCGACGATCGSPAIDCVGGSCTGCPAFVPDPLLFGFTFVGEQMGGLFALGSFTGSDGGSHALIIFADPVGLQTGVDLDLATTDQIQVLVGFRTDITSMEVQSTYGAVSGTINVGAACDDGIVATLSDAHLVESDFAGIPVPDGCELPALSATVALGADCPAEE